jgi:hypothetical protein
MSWIIFIGIFRKNFTIKLILTVKLLLKIIYHYIFLFFILFFIFHYNSLNIYIPTECFRQFLSRDIIINNSVNKIRYNLLIEIF